VMARRLAPPEVDLSSTSDPSSLVKPTYGEDGPPGDRGPSFSLTETGRRGPLRIEELDLDGPR
jgi:hypothetical protein